MGLRGRVGALRRGRKCRAWPAAAAIVLNGHDHNYQRFTSPHGVTYIVTGGGGAPPYPLENGCRTPHRNAAASQNHFTSVEITAKSVVITAVSARGKVLDRTVVPGR